MTANFSVFTRKTDFVQTSKHLKKIRQSAIEMIKVKQLVKAFGPKLAVDGVSFEVDRGEVLGFLGPNGAGKSTTMRMITGFIPPTAGEIYIAGHNIEENPIQAKRLIGYLPENAPSYSDMTVWSFLNFVAEMRGFTGQAKRKAIARVVEMCFLENVLYQRIDTLSKGYKHRTCFAQAIIHDPPILVLDEPTDGLDPNQKHEVRTLIREMGRNKAIVFSTHILEEVDAACTRAIIIDRGRIVADGTPDQLRQRSKLAGALTIEFEPKPETDPVAQLQQLEAVGSMEIIGRQNGRLRVRIFPKRKEDSNELARALHALLDRIGWKLYELRKEEGRLDEVFRSITRSDIEA